jgi:hypothetical protein
MRVSSRSKPITLREPVSGEGRLLARRADLHLADEPGIGVCVGGVPPDMAQRGSCTAALFMVRFTRPGRYRRLPHLPESGCNGTVRP